MSSSPPKATFTIWRERLSRKRKLQEYERTTLHLVVNERLRDFSARFASNFGTMVLINTLRLRKAVYKLFLKDNSLGDAGCVHLFGFLNSPPGQRFRDSVIVLDLRKNEIRANGLLAVSAFLKNNIVLRELYLSDNPLTTNPHVITEFASAISSSHLYALQINNCGSLGDAFIQEFIPRLSTPYLRELDISALNLTYHIVPILVDYLKSSQCFLHLLKCGKNMLTVVGFRKIVDSIEGNCRLRTVRLQDESEPDDMDDELDGTLWENYHKLGDILYRNLHQMKLVIDDSLMLLHYCRTLFMRSGSTRMKNGVPIFDPKAMARRNEKSPLISRLPIELQLEIFSYIAPSVSPQQCARVIAFAADVTTLFLVGPKFDGVRLVTRNLEYLVEEKLQLSTGQDRPRPKDVWIPREWWDNGSNTELWQDLRIWRADMRQVWLARVVGDAYGGPEPS